MSTIVPGAMRRRRRVHGRHLAALLGLLIAASVAAAAWAGASQLPRQVIAGGGTSHSGGGPYRLAGSIAQPVAGPASNGAYRLHSGFWLPAAAAPAGTIFHNGFED